MQIQVLLIDDDAGIRECLAEILSAQGYAVACFDSGSRALEFIEGGYVPDLFIVDLVLRPDMNGWQFIDGVKRTPTLRSAPIIAVSGLPAASEPVHECHADFFVQKPFDVDELLTMVRRVLQREHLRPLYQQ
jgi:two-component system, chemotaxis family, sensor kinase CheA